MSQGLSAIRKWLQDVIVQAEENRFAKVSTSTQLAIITNGQDTFDWLSR